MSKKEWIKQPSKQICIHKGKAGLVEFVNCMRPPSKWYPWHLHAEGGEGEEKPSLIRVVMVDYSDKNNSISVYANLRPKEVKWLFYQIAMGTKDFSFSQQKIFRENKNSDRGKVTYLALNRYETTTSGKKRDYPWRFEIQNGTGTVIRNSIGGQHCKSKSFKKEKSVILNLTDQDIFLLFVEVVAVIQACEKEHLFHQRDVENLTKLFKFYEHNMEKLFRAVGQIRKLLDQPVEKEDEMAA